MRIGLLGGSFDPVHHGHLLLAKCCREQARLDQVWLVPTAVQPLKPGGSQASAAHRVEMLRRATNNDPSLVVSTTEIERGGVSYTVDTLRLLHDAHPRVYWFFLMGADSLHDIPQWHEPEALLKLCTPLVVQRPGEPSPDFQVLSDYVDSKRMAELHESVVEMPPTPISSSELRAKLARGESITDEVPPSVAEYIAEHQLYRG